jgi:hypothetical protein
VAIWSVVGTLQPEVPTPGKNHNAYCTAD